MFNVDGINKPYGHPIYLWNGNQKLHAQNPVLAGEAACVVDSFTAEGIRPSIFSGMRAAYTIAKVDLFIHVHVHFPFIIHHSQLAISHK